MEDKKRYPTLCSWCEHCKSAYAMGRRDGKPNGDYTFCIKEHFELNGKATYPDKSECADFEMEPGVTLTEVEWWKTVWATKERDRLLDKLH